MNARGSDPESYDAVLAWCRKSGRMMRTSEGVLPECWTYDGPCVVLDANRTERTPGKPEYVDRRSVQIAAGQNWKEVLSKLG